MILTGIAGNNCILFSANDAYMREFELYIPSDCVVSNTRKENSYALRQMKKIVKANVAPSDRTQARSDGMMHLVQMLLPTHRDGAAVPAAEFAAVRLELTDRFGGVTAYSRAPASGLWKRTEDEVEGDQVIMVEVVVEVFDRDWWAGYRGSSKSLRPGRIARPRAGDGTDLTGEAQRPPAGDD